MSVGSRWRLAAAGLRGRAGHRARRLRSQRHRCPRRRSASSPIFASNTEIVASLGLADRIVGIEAYTRYPREVLDRSRWSEAALGFSVDEVVAQRPDLVVVTPSRQAANQLVDPMQRLGIPIIVLLQRNVAEILSNIRLLGHLDGVPERGEQLADTVASHVSTKVEQRVAPREEAECDHDHRPAGQRPAAGDASRAPTTATPSCTPASHLAFDAGTIAQVSPEPYSTPIPTCCCSLATKRT